MSHPTRQLDRAALLALINPHPALPATAVKRKRRASPEERIHCAVADYLRVALAGDYVWSTIPSGGGGLIRGKRLKAMGLAAGLPDLFLIDRTGAVYFIELKAPKGGLSVVQRLMHDRLRASGCQVALCRSVNQVEAALHGWGFHRRAKVAA